MRWVISGAGARPAVASLAPLLADPDPRVRRMAIRAWGRIRPGPGVSVPLLSNVLRDADPAIRTEALDILADIGKPAVPTLTRLLGRADVAYWCCMALGEIGPDAAAAAPALAKVLRNNPRPEVCREAALALGSIGPAAAGSRADVDRSARQEGSRSRGRGRIRPRPDRAQGERLRAVALPMRGEFRSTCESGKRLGIGQDRASE